MKESSFNEEYEICLKTSYETDTIPGVKPSYAQLFRINYYIKKLKHIKRIKEKRLCTQCKISLHVNQSETCIPPNHTFNFKILV